MCTYGSGWEQEMHVIITQSACASVHYESGFFHTMWQELCHASHQTFMHVNQGDLQTCTDSCHIPTDSGVQHMEQTACWWMPQTSQRGRACREDARRALMCTSCREGASPGDQTQVSRQACRGDAERQELFAWLVLQSGRKHAAACLTGYTSLRCLYF